MQNLGSSNPQRNLDSPQDFRFGEAGGRIGLVDSSKIEYAAYLSNVLEVNGVNVQLGQPLDELILCLDTDETIDSTGSETGVTPSSDTLYYAYVFNGSDGSTPRLRLSTVVPSGYTGYLYLSATGAGTNWRYVGVVALSAGAFRDDYTARLIGNEYNRLPKPFLTCPGYVDDNADTILTLASGTAWAGLNAGTGDYVMVACSGVDAIDIFANVSVSASAGATWHMGIGAQTSLAQAQAQQLVATSSRTNQLNQPCSLGVHHLPGEPKLLWISLNVYTNSSSPTVYADFGRRGATSDPYGTVLTGSVMV